jgi:quercetin dioxygenase-like cupin family protein
MIGANKRPKRAMLVLGTMLLMLAAAVVYVIPSAAEGPPPPIAAEPLTPRSVFPDEIDMKLKLRLHGRTVVININDPSRTVVVKYTVQPGAQFPWHSHRGPVFVNVVSGALTYLPADTCHERTYSAGQTLVDPGHGHTHTAFNPGREPMVFIATFFEAPAEGPLLIPADPGC